MNPRPPKTVDLVPVSWSERHPWLSAFTATLAAVLVAGTIAGACSYLLLRWTVEQAVFKQQTRPR